MATIIYNVFLRSFKGKVVLYRCYFCIICIHMCLQKGNGTGTFQKSYKWMPGDTLMIYTDSICQNFNAILLHLISANIRN